MNLDQMIDDFREERAYIDEVIIGLTKLAQKRAPKRGRPPSWSRPTDITEPKKLDGRKGSRFSASVSSGS
jgi:hypothetical protein